MIHGYRWIKTASDVWQLEGPPKSRRFHGMVSFWADGSACFCVPGGWHASYSDGRQEEHGQGYRANVRLAKDEIERHVRQKLGMECEHGVATGDWCPDCNAEYKRTAEEQGVKA